MGNKLIFSDLGTIRFKDAWDYQKKLFEQVLDLKNQNHELPVCDQSGAYHYLLFCEHPHVYTLGKNGSETNLLIKKEMLASKGAEFFKIDRGGDITYHGQGQIVGYPILNLEALSVGIKKYVELLEETVIVTLAHYNIPAGRLNGSTGVWLEPGHPGKARKICAIGVKVSKHITMHGFAFNVNTDLNYYQYINPCGFTDKGITSMQKELNCEPDIGEVKAILLESFRNVFDICFREDEVRL